MAQRFDLIGTDGSGKNKFELPYPGEGIETIQEAMSLLNENVLHLIEFPASVEQIKGRSVVHLHIVPANEAKAAKEKEEALLDAMADYSEGVRAPYAAQLRKEFREVQLKYGTISFNEAQQLQLNTYIAVVLDLHRIALGK